MPEIDELIRAYGYASTGGTVGMIPNYYADYARFWVWFRASNTTKFPFVTNPDGAIGLNYNTDTTPLPIPYKITIEYTKLIE